MICTKMVLKGGWYLWWMFMQLWWIGNYVVMHCQGCHIELFYSETWSWTSPQLPPWGQKKVAIVERWPLSRGLNKSVNVYPASSGYIFAVWAVMRKEASADSGSSFYLTCAKFITWFCNRFASNINRQVCHQMARVSWDWKKLRQF